MKSRMILALGLVGTLGCIYESPRVAGDSGATPEASAGVACENNLDCAAGSYCGPRGRCTRDCVVDVDCEGGGRCDSRGRCAPHDAAVVDTAVSDVALDVFSTPDVPAVTTPDVPAVTTPDVPVVVTPDVPVVVTPDVPVDAVTPRDAPALVDDGYLSDEEPPGAGGGSCDEDGATVPGLPLAPGVCASISQGVCGGFSHAGKYAIDIIVDPGTSVLAPVAGRVVGMRQSVPDTCSYASTAGRDALRLRGLCPASQGTDYGNYVAIAPTDGALPSLVVAHMRAGSARVSVDDVVTPGQVLGLSGSTGLSTAPHVHFACVRRGGEYGAFPTAPCNFTWRAMGASTNSTGRPGAGTTVCGFSSTTSTCTAGGSCALSGMPCRTGTTSCASGSPSCVASGNLAAGTACGSGSVCDGSGSCVSCAAGAMCTPPGQPCRIGATSCGTGAPVCAATGSLRAGTSCGAGMYCNGSGGCVACSEGVSCMPSGQPCRIGTTSCSTGSATCTATGNAAGGTACGSGSVCDGAGSCVSCSEGAGCSPSGQLCRTGTVSCASGSTVCNASGYAPAGTSCGGGSTCDGSGNCRAGETCNGVDDNGNGVVDEGVSGCWRTIYRFRTALSYPIEARCLGPSSLPPATCSGYVYEREAFVVHAVSVAGTFELRQCSSRTDHITLDATSGDRSLLESRGYDCSVVLGYAYFMGSGPSSGATPFPYSCPLYRFSYSTPGGGAKIFSVGADSTSGLTCESPARANVQSNTPCFGARPSGC